MLRNAIAAVLVMTIGIVAHEAAGQTLRNMSGADPNQLAGKTCIGVVTTGGTCETCLGAKVAQFGTNGDLLTLRFWSQFGRVAYEKTVAEMAMPNWQPEITGFNDIGKMQTLSVQGKH